MDSDVALLAAVFAIVATIVFFVLLRTTQRSHSSARRVAAAVIIVVVLMSLPGVFDAAILAMNRTNSLDYAMVDPGWPILVLPGIVALLAALLLSRVFARLWLKPKD